MASPEFSGRTLASGIATTRQRIAELGAKRDTGVISADEQNELNSLQAQLPDLEAREQIEAESKISKELPSEQDYSKFLLTPEQERASSEAILAIQLGLGGKAIQEQFAPIRGRAISEQASMGSRLLSPAGQKSIYDVDVQQGKAVSDLVNALALESAQREYGIGERGLQTAKLATDLGMQRADVLRGGRQSAKEFGLKKDVITEGQRSRGADIIGQGQANELASVLGRAEAEAAEPSAFDRAIQVTSALAPIAGAGIALAGGGMSGQQKQVKNVNKSKGFSWGKSK